MDPIIVDPIWAGPAEVPHPNERRLPGMEWAEQLLAHQASMGAESRLGPQVTDPGTGAGIPQTQMLQSSIGLLPGEVGTGVRLPPEPQPPGPAQAAPPVYGAPPPYPAAPGPILSVPTGQVQQGLAGPVGGGIVGLRTPFGPVYESGERESSDFGYFTRTGYRHEWGVPPRLDGLVWSPLRGYYEPSHDRAAGQLNELYVERASHGIYVQPYPDATDPGVWHFRWVKAEPGSDEPYEILGEVGSRYADRAPKRPVAQPQLTDEGYVDLGSTFAYINPIGTPPPPVRYSERDYVWIPRDSIPRQCGAYPYPALPVPHADYESGRWLEHDYVPSIPLPPGYDQVHFQCAHPPQEGGKRGKGGEEPKPREPNEPPGQGRMGPPVDGGTRPGMRPPVITGGGGYAAPPPPGSTPSGSDVSNERGDVQVRRPVIGTAGHDLRDRLLGGEGDGEPDDTGSPGEPPLPEPVPPRPSPGKHIPDPKLPETTPYDAETTEEIENDPGVQQDEKRLNKAKAKYREARDQVHATDPDTSEGRRARRELDRAETSLKRAAAGHEEARDRVAKKFNRRRVEQSQRDLRRLDARLRSTRNKDKQEKIRAEITFVDDEIDRARWNLESLAYTEIVRELGRSVKRPSFVEKTAQQAAVDSEPSVRRLVDKLEKLKQDLLRAVLQNGGSATDADPRQKRILAQIKAQNERLGAARENARSEVSVRAIRSAERKLTQLGEARRKLEVKQHNTWNSDRKHKIDLELRVNAGAIKDLRILMLELSPEPTVGDEEIPTVFLDQDPSARPEPARDGHQPAARESAQPGLHDDLPSLIKQLERARLKSSASRSLGESSAWHQEIQRLVTAIRVSGGAVHGTEIGGARPSIPGPRRVDQPAAPPAEPRTGDSFPCDEILNTGAPDLLKRLAGLGLILETSVNSLRAVSQALGPDGGQFEKDRSGRMQGARDARSKHQSQQRAFLGDLFKPSLYDSSVPGFPISSAAAHIEAQWIAPIEARAGALGGRLQDLVDDARAVWAFPSPGDCEGLKKVWNRLRRSVVHLEMATRLVDTYAALEVLAQGSLEFFGPYGQWTIDGVQWHDSLIASMSGIAGLLNDILQPEFAAKLDGSERESVRAYNSLVDGSAPLRERMNGAQNKIRLVVKEQSRLDAAVREIYGALSEVVHSADDLMTVQMVLGIPGIVRAAGQGLKFLAKGIAKGAAKGSKLLGKGAAAWTDGLAAGTRYVYKAGARAAGKVNRLNAPGPTGGSANVYGSPAPKLRPKPKPKPKPKQVRNSAPPPPPELPPFVKGKKTSGVLRVQGRLDQPLLSGRSGPASRVPRPAPGTGFDAYTSTHVEGHAAWTMHEQGIRNATLYINNPRICSSCSKNLHRMLPEGARLRVVLPGGEVHTFYGRLR